MASLVPDRPDPPAITRLDPVFEIEGARLALHTGELAATPARLVAQNPVADLSHEGYAIRRALDLLFSGF